MPERQSLGSENDTAGSRNLVSRFDAAAKNRSLNSSGPCPGAVDTEIWLERRQADPRHCDHASIRDNRRPPHARGCVTRYVLRGRERGGTLPPSWSLCTNRLARAASKCFWQGVRDRMAGGRMKIQRLRSIEELASRAWSPEKIGAPAAPVRPPLLWQC